VSRRIGCFVPALIIAIFASLTVYIHHPSTATGPISPNEQEGLKKGFAEALEKAAQEQVSFCRPSTAPFLSPSDLHLFFSPPSHHHHHYY
jgi:hypothetical protein